MSENPRSEELQELIAGYVLGNLTSEEAEQLHYLLENHPELLSEVDQLREVLAALPYGLPASSPPETLRSTLLETIGTTPQVTPLNSVQDFSSRDRIWKVVSGVAIMAAIGLGIQNFHLHHELAEATEEIEEYAPLYEKLKLSSTYLVNLKGTEGASGNAVLAPGHSTLMIVVKNLPTLPTGKSYQLWAIVNQEKVPSGHFNTEADGTGCVELKIANPQQVKGWAVTIETSPNPTSPTGQLILSSS
jgi:anti-sigma-K factor RskA